MMRLCPLPCPLPRPMSSPSRAHSPSPLDSLWQGKVVIWAVLAGEGLAALLTLAADTPDGRWVRFGLLSLGVQWVVLLALGGLYLLRARLDGVRPQRVAYLALALLMLSTWAVTLGCWWLLRSAGAYPDPPGDLLLRVTLIAAIVGWLALAAYQNHWRNRQLAVRAKQAELAALQARVRPHFLFNTLNTAATLVHLRPDEAEQLLLDLADLFRAALSGPREIALEEELALVRRYLEIESLRFGPRLRTRWQLPEALPRIVVPALSLQPLAENAIRHGIERLPEGGEVEIAIRQIGDQVEIVVRNPVSPTAEGQAQGHNIGLPASTARIESHSEGRGSVRAEHSANTFTVTVRLPAAEPASD